MKTQTPERCAARTQTRCRRRRGLRATARLALMLAALCATIAGAARAQTEQAKLDQFLPKKNLTPGFKIINGDIQVPLNYEPGATFQTNLWPNGTVYYEFDANVTEANRSAARAAMIAWEPGTGLSFAEGRGRFNKQDIFIHIQNSTGNNSAIGMIPGGQIMNIVSWGSRFIIAHEFGHALGLHHEHERPDRDLFVQIINANIQSGFGNQFTKLSNNTPIYGPYDFDSLMHYDRCAFSTACPAGSSCNCAAAQETIQVLGPNNAVWQSRIGQRTHISYLDGIVIASLYPRGDARFVDASYTGRQAGSFLQPYQNIATGINATPAGLNGVLWIQPGAYRAPRTITKNITLRAPLGGVTLLPPLQGVAGETLAAVSAASYNGELASESIAAAFGANLAEGTATATSLPLPITLGGVTVKVNDSEGTERDAPLFFVSPEQINYLVPAGSSVGIANVSVFKGSARAANARVPITSASPGLFTANASGQGVPAAVALRVRGEAQTIEPLLRYDEGLKRFVPAPIDLGPEGDQVFLILFGTGFRAADLSAVSVMIGGESAEVFFVGAAPGFAGLDQANVILPRSLAGKGEVSVEFVADNRSANAVIVSVR